MQKRSGPNGEDDKSTYNDRKVVERMKSFFYVCQFNNLPPHVDAIKRTSFLYSYQPARECKKKLINEHSLLTKCFFQPITPQSTAQCAIFTMEKMSI
jgi:hypothetical protein